MKREYDKEHGEALRALERWVNEWVARHDAGLDFIDDETLAVFAFIADLRDQMSPLMGDVAPDCDHNCIPCSRWFRKGWVCVRCGVWSRTTLAR